MLKQIKKVKKKKVSDLVQSYWRVTSSQKKYIQKLAKEADLKEGPFMRKHVLTPFINQEKGLR